MHFVLGYTTTIPCNDNTFIVSFVLSPSLNDRSSCDEAYEEEPRAKSVLVQNSRNHAVEFRHELYPATVFMEIHGWNGTRNYSTSSPFLRSLDGSCKVTTRNGSRSPSEKNLKSS